MAPALKSPKLHAGSNVTDITGRHHGKVLSTPRPDVYRVEWADGEKSMSDRSDLLSRFTSETPIPKAAKA
jgi:hypothetical protein